MAFKISDDCVSCYKCAEECSNGAIIEGEEHYEIDPYKCVECGACKDVCPMEAIVNGED